MVYKRSQKDQKPRRKMVMKMATFQLLFDYFLTTSFSAFWSKKGKKGLKNGEKSEKVKKKHENVPKNVKIWYEISLKMPKKWIQKSSKN